MDIRPLSQEDLVYVSAVMQRRWGVPGDWADSEVRRFLIPSKDVAGFCAHDCEVTVGVGLFNSRNDDVSKKYGPWLYLLWVDPACRGLGLGIELTKKRMEHARRHGYKEVYLDTTDAEEYHARLGWKKIDTVLYQGEQDVIMKFDLSETFPRKRK